MPDADGARDQDHADAGDERAPGTEQESAGREFRRQFQAAAEQSGLGALARNERLSGRDLLAAIGGVRGILEALLPGLVFLVAYTWLTSFAGWRAQPALIPSLSASVGLAVVFTVVRLVRRSKASQAIAGLVGVLVSAGLALWTGNARDNYVLGFVTNAAYAVALLVSLAVRWPALGLVIGFLMGDGTAWRTDRRKYRAAQLLTLVWVGLFVARLVVEVPLYVAGDVAALGATRLLMGVPLYALVLVFTWLVARAVHPSPTASSE